jgi:hypothetical protein
VIKKDHPEYMFEFDRISPEQVRDMFEKILIKNGTGLVFPVENILHGNLLWHII